MPSEWAQDGLVASGSSHCCPEGSVPTQPLVSRKFGFYFIFNFFKFFFLHHPAPWSCQPLSPGKTGLVECTCIYCTTFSTRSNTEAQECHYSLYSTLWNTDNTDMQPCRLCSRSQGCCSGEQRQLGTMRIPTVAHSLTSPQAWLGLNKHPMNRIVKLTC